MIKKAIVTGGLGFIGSHLTDLLLSKKFEVIIVDNKSNNTVDEGFFNNRCEVIVDDVAYAIKDLPKVDAVFHLAAFVGPSGILKSPGIIGKIIINDISQIIDYCIKNKALLVDISTSEIYGHSGDLSETADRIFTGDYQVRTEYAAAKMLSEIMITNKAKVEKSLRYHIIRPFNVAGDRQRPDTGFVLPRFVISALTGQPITVFDDGSQKRAFTYVGDICEAILNIYNSKFKNEVWNVGNPNNKVTIKSLADKVAKKMPYKCKIIFVDPKKIHGRLFSSVPDKIPNIDKIKKLIKWQPKISIDTVIDKTIFYYNMKVKNGYYYNILGK